MVETENIELEIVNIVASGDLGEEADLSELNESLDCAEHDPENTPGLDVRFGNGEDCPLTTLYTSGHYRIVGVDSRDELEKVHEKFIDKIRSLDEGEEIIDGNPSERLSVDNLVGYYNMDKEINLLAMANSLGYENNDYKAEIFPALTCRLEEFGCTVQLFANGKMVIPGGEDLENMENAIKYLVNEIEEIEEMERWFN